MGLRSLASVAVLSGREFIHDTLDRAFEGVVGVVTRSPRVAKGMAVGGLLLGGSKAQAQTADAFTITPILVAGDVNTAIQTAMANPLKLALALGIAVWAAFKVVRWFKRAW